MSIAIILSLFFIAPALLGYTMHVYETPRKRAQLVLQARRVRDWRGMETSRAVFIAATAVFYAAGIAIMLGAKFTVGATLILLIVNCLAGLSFLCFYWSIPAFVNRHKEPLKLFIAPIAVGVVTLSKIMSDASIAELSGLSPQDLPGAQLLLTFILTPVIWLLGLSLAFVYISIPLMIVLVIHALVQNFKHHRRAEGKFKKSPTPQNPYSRCIFVVYIAIDCHGKGCEQGLLRATPPASYRLCIFSSTGKLLRHPG